jgi:hypothetical protein
MRSDPIRDFQPVIVLSSSLLVPIVHASLEAQMVPELIALARSPLDLWCSEKRQFAPAPRVTR